jgi:hypothetical protein
MHSGLAEVWPAIRARGYFIAYAFELAFAQIGQVLSLWASGRPLVQVDWDTQLAPEPLAAFARQLNAIFHGDAQYGHEWDHIGCPHSWMLAAMLIEVNQFGCLSGSPDGRLDDALW